MVRKVITFAEALLVVIAFATLGYWGITTIQADRFQVRSARELDSIIARPTVVNLVRAPAPAKTESRDWLGRLEIPKTNLSVIVLEGDDTATLNLGVGHVPGTAMPGDGGNVVFAGHRDTFFRPLKNIQTGDEILWTSPEYSGRYRVESTRIVDPSAVEVLKPTDKSVLTLITCYPFYYIGSAPKRFVVRARQMAD